MNRSLSKSIRIVDQKRLKAKSFPEPLQVGGGGEKWLIRPALISEFRSDKRMRVYDSPWTGH